ncbi:hypothetical protein, unlikely [Anopheles sinensis]|uniref:Uncharacterized protein n=1 Tax=Anopheles sinensis TaxID=74873 RepID=A0A084WPX2_ANOSI|nr:hypothetical protein, unlikely [Anopheles sinensis]
MPPVIPLNGTGNGIDLKEENCPFYCPHRLRSVAIRPETFGCPVENARRGTIELLAVRVVKTKIKTGEGVIVRNKIYQQANKTSGKTEKPKVLTFGRPA